jgi:hypothetical protein
MARLSTRCDLTADYVRSLLDYRPETGEFFWKVRRGRILAGTRAGSYDSNGYLTIRINMNLYYAHRLAWLMVTGAWPAGQIDHRNTVTGDNCFSNFREADHQQNHRNSPLYANSTSGLKGVSWNKQKKKWDAYIGINGRKKNLGRFESKEDAHAAYKAEATAQFGEFARFE